LVLSTSAAAGVTLFVDDTTGPLSYNPSTARLTVSGDLDVNGGDILTTQTTATIFNSTVTNLSIGSAATTLSMGVLGGTATFAGAVTVAPPMEQWDRPGIIRYQDMDHIYDEIIDAMNNDKKRKAMWKNSYEYIESELLLSKINKKRSEIIEKLIN
jgi:hypothetical protein